MDGKAGAKPQIILTQVYEGEVVSIAPDYLIVQFNMGDDLEDRHIDRKDIEYKGPFWKGQPVLARCQLEILPVSEPMTADEIKKWKQEHADMTDYHKNIK